VAKSDSPALDPSQGFSRFTERARNVVIAAQNEAHAAGNAEIGVSHLVLGLLSEPEGLGASAVTEQGVPLDTVRQVATATLPGRAHEVPALVPFDAHARKALELTFREALRLGHDHVGTEHILLALLEVEDGTGVLAGLGMDKARAEAAIVTAAAARRSATES
jgi:ATP-dependent Clp protease ATP-binding subunit ClpA